MLHFCCRGMRSQVVGLRSNEGAILAVSSMPGVRVTFIVLHAHTSVLAHHFRTWHYMRTRAFLAVSFITKFRVVEFGLHPQRWIRKY